MNLRDVSLLSVLWLLTHSRCLQGNISSQLPLRGLAVAVLDVWSCVRAAQALGLPVGSCSGLPAQEALQQCRLRDGHLIPVT